MQSFIARQPILDSGGCIFAYELLFRSGLVNAFDHPDQDQASSKVIVDSSLIFDLESLAAGKRAFINVTRDVLLREYVHLLPKDGIVVEVLENVEPDEEVVQACRQLKDDGYMVALDDFVYTERHQPLVDLADFIKIDLLATDGPSQGEMLEQCGGRGIQFLAEKVETWSEFDRTRDLGFSLFQGYYFCKPAILTHSDIAGNKLNYVEILKAVNAAELDFDAVDVILKRELSLAYKLLRYINSAFFGLRMPVDSIRRALTMLGEEGVRRWVSLAVLVGMTEDKPGALVLQAVSRGRTCELLAPLLGLERRADDLFLMGMFSHLDAILDAPMADILEKLPLAGDVHLALLGGEGVLGDLLGVLQAAESANWEELQARTQSLGLSEAQVGAPYREAIQWSHQALNQGVGG